MGLTGSGKTTFVSRAVGRSDVSCGSTSSPKEVCPVRYPHPDGVHNIVLVDTPGFDDTSVSDAQILEKIARWLNAIYIENIKLNGVLYFHPISYSRVRDASARTFNVLKELCGKDNLKNVFFVTTMWDEVSEEVGSAREQELQSSFWQAMMNLGSTTHRFEGTTESAWKIINSLSISQPAERRPLQIQREMVDEYLPLHKTAAGRTFVEGLAGPTSGSKGIFKRFKRATKRTSPRASHSTSITVTLTDNPTDTPSIGTGIITLSSSGLCNVEGYRNTLAQVIPTLRAAVGAAELAHIHYLKDAIAPCLSTALSIEVSVSAA
ncbi:P-loop containing nucleoside triphosphate hydrolase protein [Pisolithus marmoratus]|nr:P-loop containing nucleoside triphosphate hydrolase protein [Pisolithus marmoratus]